MEINQEWMERMEKHSRTQARYAKLQCFFSAAAAVSCIFLALIVIRLLPQIREFTAQLQQVTVQVESVMTNLETVTADLAQADLAGMVNNVDTLVTSSQAGLEEALEKINTMDIAALNKAIKTLSDVVEPLAKFFKVFG